MDTPTIAKYYREIDPKKRKALLEQSIAAGEDPEDNAIRKELWELRYKNPSDAVKGGLADGYLALWMSMEFNKDADRKLFGYKGARKDIGAHLQRLKFKEFQEKGGKYEELLYRECCHMVTTYMGLCATDKSYNTMLCGLVSIGEEKAKEKLKADIYQTAVALPPSIKMEEELAIVTKAAREMYALQFQDEEGI